MTFTDVVTWIWANKMKIVSEFSQLFWIVYAMILPQICPNGIAQPWQNVCLVIGLLLSAYGFGNSTVVQGTTALAKKCLVKDISKESQG